MRLSREDFVPLATIVAAGCVGAAATVVVLGSLTLLDDAPVHLRVENNDLVFNALRVEIAARPALSFTVYRDLIEKVEALEARQREVAQRVSDLTLSADRVDRREEIADIRSVKQDMIEAIRDLERELDRASRAAPPLGFRAPGVAAELIRESRLKEKIRYSRDTVRRWDSQSAIALEQDIEADLEAVREQFVNDLARGAVIDFSRAGRNRR